MNGLEAFDAPQLADWLVARGCKLMRQAGSHCHWQTPDGKTVGCPDPYHKPPIPVTSLLARRVAATFDLTLHGLRTELGVATPGKSHQTRARSNVVRQRPKQQAPTPEVQRAPQVPDIITSIKTHAESIYRSGPCRLASVPQRVELHRISERLRHWHDVNSRAVS